MDDYVKSNKAAWEEAFDKRSESWGADVAELAARGDYSFFNAETAQALRCYDLRGKCVGQLCCNNGRELLSLVKSCGAARGVGFDIAENQVAFAREKANELGLPCEFVATDILAIGDGYAACFDMIIITIGALCWFRDMNAFFAVASRCLKPGGSIVINEQHPFTNMIAQPEDDEYDPEHPLQCCFSYFEHVWKSNGGMDYIAGKSYESHTFTDFTHSVGDIAGAICANGMVITALHESEDDIAGSFGWVGGRGFPLSILIQCRKASA